jgi:hypothetical protein
MRQLTDCSTWLCRCVPQKNSADSNNLSHSCRLTSKVFHATDRLSTSVRSDVFLQLWRLHGPLPLPPTELVRSPYSVRFLRQPYHIGEHVFVSKMHDITAHDRKGASHLGQEPTRPELLVMDVQLLSLNMEQPPMKRVLPTLILLAAAASPAAVQAEFPGFCGPRATCAPAVSCVREKACCIKDRLTCLVPKVCCPPLGRSCSPCATSCEPAPCCHKQPCCQPQCAQPQCCQPQCSDIDEIHVRIETVPQVQTLAIQPVMQQVMVPQTIMVPQTVMVPQLVGTQAFVGQSAFGTQAVFGSQFVGSGFAGTQTVSNESLAATVRAMVARERSAGSVRSNSAAQSSGASSASNYGTVTARLSSLEDKVDALARRVQAVEGRLGN